MPSRSCREKPLRLSGFRECVNTTSVSVRKRVHPPRINFARDRDSRIETGGRMNTPRERPNTGGGQAKKLMVCRMVFAILPHLAHRRTPVKDAVRSLPRGMSVKDDWRAWLPQEKSQVFDKHVYEPEGSYAMSCVSLV